MSIPDKKEFYTVRGYENQKKDDGRLTPALEDYLEMAYRLCLDEGYTRIKHLSDSLNVKPSSASKMVARLVTLGYLYYDSFDSIRLTDKGREVGEFLLHRHQTLEELFTLIGSENSLEETELVEHMLFSDTVMRIRLLLDFIKTSPGMQERIIDYLSHNHIN